MQTMDVISVNLWQIIISLCNLLLIYLILRKFLYAPVRKAIAARRANIDGQYADAEEAKKTALSDKAEYESKLSGAKAEADSIRAEATSDAKRRGEQIISEAKEKADMIVRRAENEAVLEKQKASEEIKKEIADVSTAIAEKLIEREIDEKDHRELIDSFIENIGSNN